ncbi:16S rRNA (cytosine(967)-C(5))-methyltransferase RsmB [Paenibacillus chartarius]|uniref:16S rRNA (cytosine(967)-C(5))-methyltransferase n=1 Tax=Paenibacillus chartarius TaxID=747481 RepID=A0ABV6DTT6_9BACL
MTDNKATPANRIGAGARRAESGAGAGNDAGNSMEKVRGSGSGGGKGRGAGSRAVAGRGSDKAAGASRGDGVGAGSIGFSGDGTGSKRGDGIGAANRTERMSGLGAAGQRVSANKDGGPAVRIGGPASAGGPAAAGKAVGGRRPKRGGGPASARSVALDVLTGVDEQGAYSNLLLNQTLQRSGLSRPDAALATELVYGTIQRLNTIDHFLGRFVRGGLAKLEPWVRSLLRLSYYQLAYLERVPDHAAVSEAVNLAKRRGHAGIAGMVNGTLRTVIRERDGGGLTVDGRGLTPAEALALRHSYPAWLCQRWIDRFGLETAERICAAGNTPPHTSVRANALRGSREELLHELQQQGVDAAPSELAPQGLVLRGGGSAAMLPQFAAGELSIQDESSMLVAELLAPEPGMAVLDCCAAPGGKTTHIAEKLRGEGAVWASDVHEHKIKLIDEQAQRLGLTNIRTICADARELAHRFPPESFDCILLDAPCSGFGVIRRKPDLKWAKMPDDIPAINAIQREILESIHPLLKPGGVLVYSTCTIEREENEDTVQAFLANHTEFALDKASPVRLPEPLLPFTGMVTILPHQFGSDGFFIARMRKANRS